MNPLKLANPVTVTKGAFGLAGTAVGLAGSLVSGTTHVVLSRLQHLADPVLQRPEQGAPGPPGAHDAPAANTAPPPGPTVVTEAPHPPEDPPIDVVGQALAAESATGRSAGADGAGLAHEPRGASRDEEHGTAAALERAEVDEIAEEAEAALEGDVEPVEHLTEPLLDPADAKALAAEMSTMTGDAVQAEG